ncbi:MAG: WbqC family protein [Bacteroidetes bacterium]|nr:WbqC family protein [Bacteroidota bacterium]
MKITCVTSRYLPNLRHISRILEVDTTVILDLAPLPHRNKDSFVYRNRIVNYTGEQLWLSLPVNRKGVTVFKNARVDPTNKTWIDKHIKTISQIYPNHNKLAFGFLDSLRSILLNSDGTILDINMKSLILILETLNYFNVKIIYQSSLTSTHSIEHRSEITKLLNADTYIAGQVEWDILEKSGQIEKMKQLNINVTRSPDLNPTQFPFDLTVSLSCIHSICNFGIEQTTETIENMIKSLNDIS